MAPKHQFDDAKEESFDFGTNDENEDEERTEDRYVSVDEGWNRTPARAPDAWKGNKVAQFLLQAAVSDDEITALRPMVCERLNVALNKAEQQDATEPTTVAGEGSASRKIHGDSIDWPVVVNGCYKDGAVNRHETTGSLSRYDVVVGEEENEEDEDVIVACDDAITVTSDITHHDPRSYQLELFEIAKEENTIIHLGTGTGKTFIAVLLVQYYLSLSQDDSRTVQTVFLVPSVALCYQQREVLKRRLDTTVGLACASTVMSEDSRQKLATSRVIVATHGAYLDLLRHYGDLFSISNVDLLILDECHNCTGKAPYAVLMKDFYRGLPEGERPRVLGLTASPLINVKRTHADGQLAEQLAELEYNMDSKIASLENYSMTADDRDILERGAEEVVVHYEQDSYELMLPGLPTDGSIEKSRERQFNQLLQLGRDLGPFPLQLFCEALENEGGIVQNLYEEESDEQFKSANKFLEMLVDQCRRACRQDTVHRGISDKLRCLKRLLEQELLSKEAVGVVFVERRITALALRHYFVTTAGAVAPSTTGFTLDAGEPTTSSTDNLGTIPKPNTSQSGQFADAEDDETDLFAIQTARTPSIKETRYLSRSQFDDADEKDNDCLFDALVNNGALSGTNAAAHSGAKIDLQPEVYHVESPPDTCSHGRTVQSVSMIRCCSLVRKTGKNLLAPGGRTETDESHEADMQVTLNGLRRGEFNVLIATSVVEEGVDVQACSFVAVFDALTTIKGYIQMKGRARQENAKFMVFQGSGPSPLDLQIASQLEGRVRRFIAGKSHRQPIQQPKVFGKDEALRDLKDGYQQNSAELQALLGGQYVCKNGSVDFSSAKSLLYRFALMQPMDTATRLSRTALQAYMPMYDDVCHTLMLPAYLGATMSLRRIALPEKFYDQNKKEKQSILALMACVRLHQHDLLSDRLLPYSRKEIRRRIRGLVEEVNHETKSKMEPFKLDLSATQNTVYVYALVMSGDGVEEVRRTLVAKGTQLAVVCLAPISANLPIVKFMHKQLGSICCEMKSVRTSMCSREELTLLYDFYTVVMNARWKRRTLKSAFSHRFGSEQSFKPSASPPYAVGCIAANGSLDWSLMQTVVDESKRSMDELAKAANSYSRTGQPRLCYPRNKPLNTYISFGPTGAICGDPLPEEPKETYCDLFRRERNVDVDADEPLCFFQRCWDLPNRETELETHGTLTSLNQTGSPELSPILITLTLAPSICVELPFANAELFLESLLLPMLLFRLERNMTADFFVNYCKLHFPRLGGYLGDCSTDDVLSILTAQRCTGEQSYELLEWLGDGVLKLVSTDAVIRARELQDWVERLHEGDLDTIRAALCSNEALEKVCDRVGFAPFIWTSPLSRGHWTPSSLILCQDDRPGVDISGNDKVPKGKICADVMEAVLGLVYRTSGYEAARTVAAELRITIPYNDEDSPLVNVHTAVPSHSLLSAVKVLTGYEAFNNPSLLIEAFTHPTCMEPNISSYQRLEWIGDAVLCLAARERLYELYSDGKHTVGVLAVAEESIVANQILSFLSLQSGIYKNIRHHDSSLSHRIDLYYQRVVEERRGIWGTEPLKVLADVMESILGAIYIDGGIQAGMQAALYMVSPVLELFQNIEDPSVLSHNPSRLIRNVAGSMVTLSKEESSGHVEQKLPHLSARTPSRRRTATATYRTGTLEVCQCPIVTVEDDQSDVCLLNRGYTLLLGVLQQEPKLYERFKKARKRLEYVGAATK